MRLLLNHVFSHDLSLYDLLASCAVDRCLFVLQILLQSGRFKETRSRSYEEVRSSAYIFDQSARY